jgi:uncharacterized protein
MSIDMRSRVFYRDSSGNSVPIPDWLQRSHAIFRKHILHREYPCNFGTVAEKQGDLKIAYIEGTDQEHIPQTLATFLSSAALHPNRQQVLALFFEPEEKERNLEYYQERFWNLLQYLHDHDPSPWPEDIPLNPDDPYWEFTFNGVPMFVFEAAPAYRQRLSRNLGPGMIVLFQPRNVFNHIEGDTPAGRKARRTIRQRSIKWDHMGIHPDMGSYPEKNNREWKQYFLPDNITPVQGQCPLHLGHAREPVVESAVPHHVKGDA